MERGCIRRAELVAFVALALALPAAEGAHAAVQVGYADDETKLVITAGEGETNVVIVSMKKGLVSSSG